MNVDAMGDGAATGAPLTFEECTHRMQGIIDTLSDREMSPSRDTLLETVADIDRLLKEITVAREMVVTKLDTLDRLEVRLTSWPEVFDGEGRVYQFQQRRGDKFEFLEALTSRTIIIQPIRMVKSAFHCRRLDGTTFPLYIASLVMS